MESRLLVPRVRSATRELSGSRVALGLPAIGLLGFLSGAAAKVADNHPSAFADVMSAAGPWAALTVAVGLASRGRVAAGASGALLLTTALAGYYVVAGIYGGVPLLIAVFWLIPALLGGPVLGTVGFEIGTRSDASTFYLMLAPMFVGEAVLFLLRGAFPAIVGFDLMAGAVLLWAGRGRPQWGMVALGAGAALGFVAYAVLTRGIPL